MDRKPNRLINEKSPYLLQHAYNPVDWYPWSDEAFERAKKEDKPIFLSIGYSTCHWCHVMEKESFEDEEVAEILNKVFVCIKVDKEERPDIDAFYMDICNILTGRGGWPLNVFMTHEKEPFYSATYIPKETSGNNIGIKELAKAIDFYWNNKREELLKSSTAIMNIIKSFGYERGKGLDESIFNENFSLLSNNFDVEYGGFGNDLKFPPYNNLFFLTKYYQISKDQKALEMVEKTLDAIRCGGIFDFVAGGIHRYATDRFWVVPHFEKMLYDQALISILYSKAYLISQKKIYLETSKEIVNYCLEYLKNPEGGFFCGEDADSEGVEGKFYQWEEEELKRIFSTDEFAEFSQIFSISSEGNFREETKKEFNGKNILYINKSFANRYLNDETIREKINSMMLKLKFVRDKRIRPHRDEKILFDWNCLIVIALLYLARITEDEKYKIEAVTTIDFLEKNLIENNFRLSHAYFKGTKKNFGFLEDYAYLLWCYLELYLTFFDGIWLEKAFLVSDKIIEQFMDKEKGGFFHTPEFLKEIPVRQKIIVDSVMPSGNSVLLYNFLRLFGLTDDLKYFNLAKMLIETFSNAIKEMPLAYNFFINSLSLYFDYPGKIKLVLKRELIKNEVYYFLRRLASLDWIIEIRKDESINSEILAEICSKNTCSMNFRNEEDFLNFLKNLKL